MNANDPLASEERDEYETDLIAFSDRELDLLGDIRGRNVLYAGGTSPLWVEGLAERIGASGSLTVLDLDEEGMSKARDFFDVGELSLFPQFVVGDVFDPPFGRASFDLVYSSGLFHELDVSEKGAGEAFSALANTLRPDGRLATSDFVDDGAESAQIEDERIEAEVLRLTTGAELFGIGDSERLIEALESVFPRCEHSLHPPFEIRHLDKLFLAEPEHSGLDSLAPSDAERLLRRRERLRERVRGEGYTRPATLFFEASP